MSVPLAWTVPVWVSTLVVVMAGSFGRSAATLGTGRRPPDRVNALPLAGRLEVGHQAVPHREQPGCGPVVGAGLGVDVLDVGADGLGRQDQSPGDLAVAEPPGEQTQ